MPPTINEESTAIAQASNIVAFPGTNPDTVSATEQPQMARSTDDIRHDLLEGLQSFQPKVIAFQAESQRFFGISIEYHDARLAETFGVPIEELTLLTTFNIQETPQSLDAKLEKMKTMLGLAIKKIYFDRQKGVYYLFI